MTVNIRIPRFASSGFSPGSTKLATEPFRAASTFRMAPADSDEEEAVKDVGCAVFVPRPEGSEARQPGPASLARAWSWLHAKYTLTATKRLRVAETVSLGEKRFVSIVCVGGREFLVGGGSAGVSLLADLTPAGGFASAGPMGAGGDTK